GSRKLLLLQLRSVHRATVVLRSSIVTGPEPSPFVRSVVTRRAQSYSSGSCPSSAWCVRSPRISRLTCASSRLPSWLCRKPLRPTWWVFSRTPTCVPFTPSALPSCPRTSSWPGASAESVL
ncbi:histone H3-like 20, partial [Homarus americanus]